MHHRKTSRNFPISGTPRRMSLSSLLEKESLGGTSTLYPTAKGCMSPLEERSVSPLSIDEIVGKAKPVADESQTLKNFKFGRLYSGPGDNPSSIGSNE